MRKEVSNTQQKTIVSDVLSTVGDICEGILNAVLLVSGWALVVYGIYWIIANVYLP